jgi:hypothetical protein
MQIPFLCIIKLSPSCHKTQILGCSNSPMLGLTILDPVLLFLYALIWSEMSFHFSLSSVRQNTISLGMETEMTVLWKSEKYNYTLYALCSMFFLRHWKHGATVERHCELPALGLGESLLFLIGWDKRWHLSLQRELHSDVLWLYRQGSPGPKVVWWHIHCLNCLW